MDVQTKPIWPLTPEGLAPTYPGGLAFSVIDNQYFSFADLTIKPSDYVFPNSSVLNPINVLCIDDLSSGMYQGLATNHLDQMILASNALRILEEKTVAELSDWCSFTHDLEKQLTLDELIKLSAEDLKRFCTPFEHSPVELARIEFLLEQRKRFKELRTFIERTIAAIQNCLNRITRRFCQMNWTFRVWFLLHGSHPPKTDLFHRVEFLFGCA